MADPTNFHLQVTAGPSYDPSTHVLVPVNTEEPIHIDSDHISADLKVRIQNYRGLPKHSPETSPYFSDPNHTSSLYSIEFTFTPKTDINGDALVFGNDFENPIRDNLPPGFGTALRFVRWAIDPGLDGDVYADKPYLYGPLLSSINVLHIGDKQDDRPETPQEPNGPSKNTTVDAEDNDDDETNLERDQSALEASQVSQSHKEQAAAVLQEGGTTPSGSSIRTDHQIPPTSAQRMKHFLTQPHRQSFSFEKGRSYGADFFNPYLDFNELALKLPGISLQLMRFWDGQPLRYTLRERGVSSEEGDKGRELLVVVFTLIPEEEVAAQEAKWANAGTGAAAASGVRGTARAGARPVDQTGLPGGGGGGGDDDVD